MKIFNYILILAFAATMFSFSSCASQRTNNRVYYQHGSEISFQVFYRELSPHGRWVYDRYYGQIWIPTRVGRNFHPFATNGHWVMTNQGNMWVSGYSWGWAPFHYGRWFWSDFYGWAWVPGYVWAPAWVVWRSGGGFYGWAPMPPGVHVNINIMVPPRHWTFVPNRHVFHRNPSRHFSRNTTIIHNTTIINNTYIINNNQFFSGPSAQDFRRDTGRNANVRTIETTSNRSARSTSVTNNSVRVYRPDAAPTRATATNRSAMQQQGTTTRGAVQQQGTTTRQTQQNVAPNRTATQPQQGATTRGTATQPQQGTTRQTQQNATQQNATQQNATQQQGTTTRGTTQQQQQQGTTTRGTATQQQQQGTTRQTQQTPTQNRGTTQQQQQQPQRNTVTGSGGTVTRSTSTPATNNRSATQQQQQRNTATGSGGTVTRSTSTPATNNQATQQQDTNTRGATTQNQSSGRGR